MSKKQLMFKIVIRLVFIAILIVCFIFGCRYSRAECLVVVGNSGSATPWRSEHLSARTPMRREVLNCDSDSAPPVTLQPWFNWTPMPDYTPVPTPEPSVSPDSSGDPSKAGSKYVPHNDALYISNYSTYLDESGNTKYSYYTEEDGLKYVSDAPPSSVLFSYDESPRYLPYWFGELPMRSCVFNLDIAVYMNQNPISIPTTGEFIYSLDFYAEHVKTYLQNALYINVPYFISLDIQYVGALNGEPVYLYDSLFPISTGSSSFGLSSESRDLVGVMDVLTFVRFKLHITPDISVLNYPDTENVSCSRFKFRFKDFSNLSESFVDQMTNLFVPSGNELSDALGRYQEQFANDSMGATFSTVIGYLQDICSSDYKEGSSSIVIPPLSVRINGEREYYFKGGLVNLKKGYWQSGGVADSSGMVFYPAIIHPFGDDDTSFSITNDIFQYLRSFNTVLITFGFCNLMVDMIFRYRNGSRFYLSDKEQANIS